jgi:ubiquitin carboxyl-terminal hydrolase 25
MPQSTRTPTPPNPPNDSSFAALGIVPESDDPQIIEAYQKQVKDNPRQTLFYLECLQDIGSSTQSKRINQFAEGESANGFYTKFDLIQAYQTLDIENPDFTTDDAIIATYQSRCFDFPEREMTFQRALIVIQVYRKSVVIEEFINPSGKRGTPVSDPALTG